MNRIVTIGREFGSGGRELGKRLADTLGVPCYDKEIIREISALKGVTPEYVEHITQLDIRQVYSSTIGRSFAMPIYYNNNAIELLVSQQEVIKRLAAQGDCVLVGRNADLVLADMKPLNLFVYADKASKVGRCLERAKNGETEKDIVKQMQRIDKERAAGRRAISDSPWGKMETYHLCVNTSGIQIKSIVPALADYVNAWFAAR